MGKLQMPTTLPSLVDRGGFRFIAIDGEEREWLWGDDELVWCCGRPRERQHAPSRLTAPNARTIALKCRGRWEESR